MGPRTCCGGAHRWSEYGPPLLESRDSLILTMLAGRSSGRTGGTANGSVTAADVGFDTVMTGERRYQEDEIREIFESAASARDASRRGLSSGEGLSLAELQEIGLEVGLAPERIAEAAFALDLRRGSSPRRNYLGMPISVGRTIELPRAPTDREWELLVAELRETFQARGTVGSHGGLRHWTNGNLHAYVEPTETGHRLRMGTLKGSAMAMNTLGAMGLVFALIMLVVMLVTGQLPEEGFFIPVLFGALGGAALAAGAVGLPRWAREREEQMEYIAARARALIGPETATEGG